MIPAFRPATQDELRQRLIAANVTRAPLGKVDLGAFNRWLEHTPEDMTATVECGIGLAEFQRKLGSQKQWLPMDPPFPERINISDLLAFDLNGPRRFGYGTIREHILGLTVMLADGRIVRSGGKVVKNVAGFDVHKLFIGARESLCIMLECTFKLQPLPAREVILGSGGLTPESAEKMLRAIKQSALTPVIFDLHNQTPDKSWRVVVGFDGSEEGVAWQVVKAAELGLREPGTLGYEAAFHSRPAERLSVLPSKLLQTIQETAPTDFVARAGNGILWYRGGSKVPTPTLHALHDRAKTMFDPHFVFPHLQP